MILFLRQRGIVVGLLSGAKIVCFFYSNDTVMSERVSKSLKVDTSLGSVSNPFCVHESRSTLGRTFGEDPVDLVIHSVDRRNGSTVSTVLGSRSGQVRRTKSPSP